MECFDSWVTILRAPVPHFRSAWKYWQIANVSAYGQLGTISQQVELLLLNQNCRMHTVFVNTNSHS